MKCYILVDHDNNIYEVFKTLEAAKSYAENDLSILEEGGDEFEQYTKNSWGYNTYLTIFEREMKK